MFKKVKLSMNSVKRDILKLLAQKEGSHFGDIVQDLSYSYTEILENLLELKKDGKIYKASNPPLFKIVK
jgi:predicted transcriptional regulator